MKSIKMLAATLSLAALSVVSLPASAQDASKPTVETNPSTGKPVIVVPATAGANDQYKAAWAFRNLDDREVKRYKARGFSDTAIKAAGNIALRTGLEVDYILRLVQEAGHPLAQVAAMYNVSTLQLTEEIPGYGAEAFAVGLPATPTTRTSMNDSGMTMSSSTTTSSTASVSSSSLPPSNTTTNSSISTNTSTTTSPTIMGTVVDVAMMDPDFSTMTAAIKAADLVETLKGSGPYTILAPSNAAWQKLPAGTLDNLLKPENKEKLRQVLLFHVVPGKIMAADVMGMTNPSTPRTLNGATLNVKTTAPVMINDANVIKTDINGSNGVIHVIDTVLVPAGMDLSAPAASTAPAAPAEAPATPATP